MARRNLLHKSKLADFKEWLSMNGIQWRDGKGSYRVIGEYGMRLDTDL